MDNNNENFNNQDDNERYKEYLKSDKWKQLARKRYEIDNGVCQCCGSRGTIANPIECHHLSYSHLYHEEGRIYEDLVSLCRVCHKCVHRMMERVTNDKGRRGWLDSPRIPRVHTFCVNGTDIEYVIKEDKVKK